MQMRYARYFLLNCCPYVTKIICFNGLIKRNKLKQDLATENENTNRKIDEQHNFSFHYT